VAPTIPTVSTLLWPTLGAVRAMGHSGTIEEIDQTVIDHERFTEEQQAVLHNGGPRSKIEYRLAWARTHLKGMGLLDNSTRGVWATTERGRTATGADVDALHREYRAALQRGRKRRSGSEDPVTVAGSDVTETDWQERLLQAMLGMSAEGFERLAQRLLRAAGFVNTTVTARSGDGGIDGVGVYRLSLVGFPVFFQCKRYKGSVGPDKVRDFRGALAGRGDKGLLITTGTFTAEAKREASRDGAPPIDLIDGERLCELLKEHGLGVRVTERVVEDVAIAPEFFAEL
jgi:restriction system protein